MTLSGKTAVIFAAYGGVASGVARAMAQAGATVHLSGRNLAATQQLADAINASGGIAHAHEVDALNETQVNACLAQVADAAGAIHTVFNGVGMRAAEAMYATPAPYLPLDAFMQPLRLHVGSQFLTARAAQPYLARSGGGSVVLLSASLGKDPAPFMAGIGAACGAIEALTRALAAEYALFGGRVNCVNGGAMTETRTIQETTALNAQGAGMTAEQFTEMLRQRPLTRRFPTVAEVAQVAVFLASDASSSLTGQVLNATAGLVLL